MATRYPLGPSHYAVGCSKGGCDSGSCIKIQPWTLCALAKRLGDALWKAGDWLCDLSTRAGLTAALAARCPAWSCRRCDIDYIEAPACPRCGAAAPARRCSSSLTGIVESECDKPAGHEGAHKGWVYAKEVEW